LVSFSAADCASPLRGQFRQRRCLRLPCPESPRHTLDSNDAGEVMNFACSGLVSSLDWLESTVTARLVRSCKAVHRELYSDGRLRLAHVVIKARTAQYWLQNSSVAHVQHLELRPCGQATLRKALGHLPNLHSLRTIKCKGQTLTPGDCKMLAAVATRPNSVLQMINIESCKVNDEGAMALADTGTLATLCIRLNSLTDLALESFASNLLRRQLQVLNLKGNRVSDIGVLSLCHVLGSCQHLRVLNLRNNKVTCIGASALAQAIDSHACGVKVLRLRSNLIRDVGAKDLSVVVDKLHELDLDQNKLTDIGKEALEAAMISAQARGLTPIIFPVAAEKQ